MLPLSNWCTALLPDQKRRLRVPRWCNPIRSMNKLQKSQNSTFNNVCTTLVCVYFAITIKRAELFVLNCHQKLAWILNQVFTWVLFKWNDLDPMPCLMQVAPTPPSSTLHPGQAVSWIPWRGLQCSRWMMTFLSTSSLSAQWVCAVVQLHTLGDACCIIPHAFIN